MLYPPSQFTKESLENILPVDIVEIAKICEMIYGEKEGCMSVEKTMSYFDNRPQVPSSSKPNESTSTARRAGSTLRTGTRAPSTNTGSLARKSGMKDTSKQ